MAKKKSRAIITPRARVLLPELIETVNGLLSSVEFYMEELYDIVVAMEELSTEDHNDGSKEDEKK